MNSLSLWLFPVSLLIVIQSDSVISWPLEVPTVNNLPLQSNGHHLDAVKVHGTSVGAVGRDPDAIVYPDELIRDSYGNAVTPFHGLLEHQVEIGHMTDVNKQTPLQPGNGQVGTATIDSSGFVIPSYASGITKVETLFPNAPKFPLVAPTKKTPQVVVQNPLPSVSGDVLPPFGDSENRVVYPQIEVNTETTLFFNGGEASFGNNNQHQNGGAAAGVPVNGPKINHPTPKTTTTSTTISQSGFPINNSKNQNSGRVPLNGASGQSPDIYTGSFGGSSGVLGQSQPLGWAYTTKNPEGIPGASAPTHSPVVIHQQPHHPSSVPSTGSFLDLNLLPPSSASAINVPVPPVSDPSGMHHHQHQPQKPQHHHQSTPAQNRPSSDVYTGSFGGAPGILKPFDNTSGRRL